MTDGLDALGVFGPFFAVQTHAEGERAAGAWRPVGELLDDEQVLADRISAVRRVLATSAGARPEDIERRVAGSVMHLGVAARLISPVLGYAALTGRVLAFDPTDWWWQPETGGAFPLSVTEVTDRDDDVPSIQAAVLAIGAATVSATGVSSVLLRGNVASAINGAARMVASTRTDRADEAYAHAARLADRLALTELFTGGLGPGFRRRSCCLIYRTTSTTPYAVCGDCVFGR